MKCIKAIKSQKTAEIGDMARINDVDAEIRVRTGYWKYIPKSEWKNKNNESSETQNAKIDSEVKNMTGLGDVLASYFGGIEIRTKPGLPPWGLIKKIPGDIKLVLCIIGKPLNTKEILKDKKILLKIKEIGAKYTKKLNDKPTLENLFLYSDYQSL